MKFKKRILFNLFFVLSNYFGISQDIKAGELMVDNLSNKTYQAKFKYYYQTFTYTSRPYILVNWGDGSALDTVFLTSLGSGCGVFNSQSAIYMGIHTYTNYGSYIISCVDSFRVANIQNISNSSKEKMVLQYHLNANAFLGANDSPFSTGCALSQLQCCVWSYNSGEVDIDGDSLSYSLTAPFTTNYTLPPTSNVDVYGTFSFTPTSIGLYAFCLKIDEWRKMAQNNYLVGSSFREILFEVSSLISVEELASGSRPYSIYPNPISNVLHIKTEQYFDKETSIEIINTLGQIIFTHQYASEIDISSLTNGCYIVLITSSHNQKFYSKFIKE